MSSDFLLSYEGNEVTGKFTGTTERGTVEAILNLNFNSIGVNLNIPQIAQNIAPNAVENIKKIALEATDYVANLGASAEADYSAKTSNAINGVSKAGNRQIMS
jgi:hypothetical protein